MTDTTTPKKTRNRKPKAATYNDVVPLVHALSLTDKIELVKALKGDIKTQIEQQQSVADLAKDL